ncbi:MAG: 30S ribosomal protein S12 methylthiotransferase RimO [Eubacteriales bacterium]
MKIYIDTLGCPKNITDSEYAAGILEKAGHKIIENPALAKVLIVNTCGFINDAKKESIDTILELASYKNEKQILVVSGCLSKRYSKQLFKELPEVDIFLGVNEYDKLPSILQKHVYGKRERFITESEKEYIELGERKLKDNPYTAYLKISEGCDNHCAYCVIPSIRGNFRSRRIEEIVKEAKELSIIGCKEITIVAQDVTAYGIDLYGTYQLPKLLQYLTEIQGIEWIRLMYCYEDEITDELINAIAENEKICKYIDIPIQHCSDKILTSMNRRSTKESIYKTINKLRERIPGISIRTTLITGFPGETKEDFDELYNFVKEMRFNRLGVFHYSKEAGTPAAKMTGQVPEKTKIKRKDMIMALQKDISLELNEKKIGDTIKVLIEEKIQDEETYLGRSEFDAKEIDQSIIFTSKEPLIVGTFAMVKIVDALDYDLIGEVN